MYPMGMAVLIAGGYGGNKSESSHRIACGRQSSNGWMACMHAIPVTVLEAYTAA